jgi:polygalacturonase
MRRSRLLVTVVAAACIANAPGCGAGNASTGNAGASDVNGSSSGSGAGMTGNASGLAHADAGVAGSGEANRGSGGNSGNAGTKGSLGGNNANGGAGGAASGGGGTSGSTSGNGGGSGTNGGNSGGCGAGDANMPAEPTMPPVCATLMATQSVTADGVPSESTLDTSAIQSALGSCASGQAVKLATSGSNNAFVTGPLTLPAGVTLWVDGGITLYGTRDPTVYGAAPALISVGGASSGIMGEGVIDGQGGEPMIGQTQSWWDSNAGSSGNSPALIQVRGATNFTLYQITLHNSPKFHVKLGANGFVVWGVTIHTPSKSKNSQGTPLTPSSAHNTDGIDPGEAASNGYIVCSKISVGDDHIAIKGTNGVDHLIIAHNHFGAGHGMSIGSEFQGGVSNVNVYDLSIDGTNTGLSGGSSNGIRIKSDSSRGGLVSNITYSDVCVRQLANPIILTPNYSSATGTSIPQYTKITIKDFHSLGSSVTPKVTLDGYSSSVMNRLTLDNVIVEGILPSNVKASYTDVTLGPGTVNFMPAGTSVNVTDRTLGGSAPNACAGKWVTF